MVDRTGVVVGERLGVDRIDRDERRRDRQRCREPTQGEQDYAGAEPGLVWRAS
jgi:hypothetical protein